MEWPQLHRWQWGVIVVFWLLLFVQQLLRGGIVDTLIYAVVALVLVYLVVLIPTAVVRGLSSAISSTGEE